jgi:PIN domain nuclease of toxin-antitoxin system
MVFTAVADTHAAVWYLFADPRLSTAAKSYIDGAIASELKVAISPISLAEIIYLEEKKRLPAGTYRSLKRVFADPEHVFHEAAFTAEVAEAMRGVSRNSLPDMPDRIVAATAAYLGVPILSRDGRIRSSGVKTIW